MTINITQRGLDFIKRKEGYSSTAYRCSAGIATIGWGSIRWDSNTPVRMGDTISEDQATRLLLREVQRVEDAIEETITVPLTRGEADCLISLFYNIGIGWLTGRGHTQATLVRYLNKGQYGRIPSEILKFRKANGKVIRGLETRRKEEIRELWFADSVDAEVPLRVTETDPEAEPMPQRVEPERGKVSDAVRESWTLRGAAISLAAYIADKAVGFYDLIFGVAKQAGPEIMNLKTTMSPFDPLIKLTPTILATLVIAGLFIVVARRISACVNGKEG